MNILVLFAGLANAAVVDRVAAVVNEDVIALSEVYDIGGLFIEQRCGKLEVEDSCRREAELEILDSLILRSLTHQELDRLNLGVSGPEVDRMIDQIARENGLKDRFELQAEVERSGTAWSVYRDHLNEQLRQMKFTENVIRPRISVSDDEVLDRYQRTVREYEGPKLVQLEALSLAIPEDADLGARAAIMEQAGQIATVVNTGEKEWQAAIQEFDSGIYKPRDGKMGTFKQGELMSAIDVVAFATEEGKVGDPIDLGNSVLLMRVVKFEESDVLPYEEAEGKLREKIYEDKITVEVEQWYQQARRRASVRILLEEPWYPR